jgi:hypothetical protein
MCADPNNRKDSFCPKLEKISYRCVDSRFLLLLRDTWLRRTLPISVAFVCFVAADHATCERADRTVMAGIVPNGPAHHRAFDAALRLRRHSQSAEGERQEGAPGK